MEFRSFHGFYAEEQMIGNTFIVDLTLTLSQNNAENTDDLSHTINYEQVYKIVKREMEITSKLLEHVAHRIKSAIKIEFPTLLEIEITLKKMNPPLGGKVNFVAIKL